MTETFNLLNYEKGFDKGLKTSQHVMHMVPDKKTTALAHEFQYSYKDHHVITLLTTHLFRLLINQSNSIFATLH